MPTNKKTKSFNPFPKYLQLREILRKRMFTEYEIGGRLPSEEVLCAEFGISRETVREALREFQAEGIIERYRAQGTFLVRRPEGAIDPRLTGHAEDFSALNLNTHATVLTAKAITAPPEAEHLQDNKKQVFFIRRLRYFDGIPLALHDAFLSLSAGQKLKSLDLSKTSILRELEQTLDIPCFEEREQIEATLASEDMAKELDIQAGAPLLLITRHFVNEKGKPLLFFKSYYRSDRYYYTLNLSDRRASNRRASRSK